MSKNDEKNYLKNIGPGGIAHAANKPFSDPECGNYLIDLGFIMSLLPQPPLKVLDLGCGTGWTSIFFSKRGYNVTGQDISEDMIRYATINKNKENLENLEFVVNDYEEMEIRNEFDSAVFYDSLHHAEDPALALRKVYLALKNEGICITCEPGRGHAKQSVGTIEKFRVTEKDMPPTQIIKLGKAAGFREFQVYPRLMLMGKVLYKNSQTPLINILLKMHFVRYAAVLWRMWSKNNNGIVVLMK